MKENEFLEIIKGYEGEIVVDDCYIIIKATNNLNGKRVKCVMSYNRKQGYFDGFEQTYSILGGFGYPKDSFNEEDVKKQMDRYCFLKKKVEQLSLW